MEGLRSTFKECLQHISIAIDLRDKVMETTTYKSLQYPNL